MKYEYAFQWRFGGEKDWCISRSFRVLRNAEEAAIKFLDDVPLAEVRIVRRPINDWEVVK